ncbi:T9SS type B sorting domain-containing protein [Ulvibacterium sp.]|uniref:T9SS type B sorting domain-containing protein n=1 Tax=Ulvibacterium sp. TaxID=2665914 RepID=UPI003BA8FAD0
MLKKLLIFLIFNFQVLSYAQICTSFVVPSDGNTDVPVDTRISWQSVPGILEYIISIGTSPGGGEILDGRRVGTSNAYTPPVGLPEMTQIYITITLVFDNGADQVCQIGSFFTEDVLVPPPCTRLRNPFNGAEDIDRDANIIWFYAAKASGYFLSLGTDPNATNILNNFDVGRNVFYDLPDELPPESTIYSRITPYNENGNASNCPIETFRTRRLPVLVECSQIVSPVDGSIDVSTNPVLEWSTSPGAIGYEITITDIISGDVVIQEQVNVNTLETRALSINTEYSVSIVPFNTDGNAVGCTATSFTTVKGCGPFVDPGTGEETSLKPDVNFPDQIVICSESNSRVVRSEDTADGFRWYRINSDGTEELLAQAAEITLTEEGDYRYEAYNTVSSPQGPFECASSKFFQVISSEIGKISDIDIRRRANGIRIELRVEGSGDYEFSLNTSDGPYQDSNVFEVPLTKVTIYIRDKNGCGILEQNIEPDLLFDGFPKFFTPNGDGRNDFWQFQSTGEGNDGYPEVIHIFDRYGNLLLRLDPETRGWDGNFKGKPLPASDYWFIAKSENNEELKGHFALKR